MAKKPPTKTGSPERLHSLDALRGFDMFWIIGGGALISAASKTVGWGWLHRLAQQMDQHVSWEGLHFHDLIFPLFMFISGVAIPYAVISKREKEITRSKLLLNTLRRMVVLILLGIVYNGALQNGFHNMRIASVLAQIGIAYFLASAIVIHTDSIRPRLFWVAGILGSIAILQLLVPLPGFGAGNLTPAGSINAWIDQHFLPGKLIYGTYDPEGILCIFSATSVTLMGSLAGSILRKTDLPSNKKIAILLLSGAGLVAVAFALSPVYPIIKKIWTVPFDLAAVGFSALLLALFYGVIDVMGWRKGAFFFKVIGLNSITIYLGTHIIDFHHASNFLLGWLIQSTGSFGNMVFWAGVVILEWLFLYHLYRNKIFLKV